MNSVSYRYFLAFIALIHLVYVVIFTIDEYMIYTKSKNTKLKETLEWWNDILENMFLIFVSFILIFRFFPYGGYNVQLSNDEHILLFILGFITLMSIYKNVTKK